MKPPGGVWVETPCLTLSGKACFDTREFAVQHRLFRYEAFGLSIESQIELVGLEPMDRESASVTKKPDIAVIYGKVPENLEGDSAKRAGVQVGPECVLITRKRCARFLISGGEQVVVEPLGDAPLHKISMFITGSCLGAALHQRMKLTFHGGGAILRDGVGSVMFLGRKGAGKSTLMAMLGRKGYDVLADDLCVVDKTDESFRLLPGIPSIRLCRQSLDSLGQNAHGLQPVRTHCDKYLVPVAPKISREVQVNDIKGIYILAWGTGTSVRSVARMDAVPLLIRSLYRRWMIGKIMGDAGIFRTCSRIAQGVPVYAFVRPKNVLTMDEPLGYLMDHLGR